MRLLYFFFLALATVTGLAAQQTDNPPGSELRYDTGTFSGGVYANECFGFSLALPDGWQVNLRSGTQDAKVRATPIGQDLKLFQLTQGTAQRLGKSLILMARDSTNLPASAQEYVTSEVQERIRWYPFGQQLLRTAFPVEYGGSQFYRSDYKMYINDSGWRYIALVYTKFRGYMLGGILAAGSPDDLDSTADLLRQISFHDDQVNPRCIAPVRAIVLGKGEGVIGKVIGSPTPVLHTDAGKPAPVRVSEGVSQTFVVKRIDPEYPELARKAGIQGKVILYARISETGDVENVELISGHPLLVPFAIAAVQKWKYKPYLLKGKAVEIETQVTLAFELPK